MIVFAALFAVIDTYLITQLNFWGVTPLSILAILYTFREETTMLHGVAAAATYGLVVGSLNKDAGMSLLIIAGLCLATLGSYIAREISQSMLGKKLHQKFDLLITAVVFCTIYWLTQAVWFAASLSPRAVAMTIVVSAVLNTILMASAVLVSNRLEVRRG